MVTVGVVWVCAADALRGVSCVADESRQESGETVAVPTPENAGSGSTSATHADSLAGGGDNRRKRVCRPWTADDMVRLQHYVVGRKSTEEMCAAFNRSPDAIHCVISRATRNNYAVPRTHKGGGKGRQRMIQGEQADFVTRLRTEDPNITPRQIRRRLQEEFDLSPDRTPCEKTVRMQLQRNANTC